MAMTKTGKELLAMLEKVALPYVATIQDTDLEFWVNPREHNPGHLHIRRRGAGGIAKMPMIDLNTFQLSDDACKMFSAAEKKKIIEEAKKFAGKFKEKFERSMSQRNTITPYEVTKWTNRVEGVYRDHDKIGK